MHVNNSNFLSIVQSKLWYTYSMSEKPKNLWDRLFSSKPLTDTGRPAPQRRVALPISKENISGFFDVKIEVNPEEQFDRQALLNLFQITAPAIQDYPIGTRLMLKRIWGVFDQHGFDDVYPEDIALLQTQQRALTIQVQIATFQQQLAQLEQQAAQAEIQALSQDAQNFQKTGQISPGLSELAQTLIPQGANGTTSEPPTSEGL